MYTHSYVTTNDNRHCYSSQLWLYVRKMQKATHREKKPKMIAVIIAGGRAKRMGGGNKGLYVLAGRPIIAHVWAAIAPQVTQVALNINESLERFTALLPNITILSDAGSASCGPLSGVLAGLRWAATQRRRSSAVAVYLLTVPSDTPFLPENLVARLLQPMLATKVMVAFACSGGRLHPLIGLWDIALVQSLADFLVSGGRTVRLFLSGHQTAMVNFTTTPLDPFMNINTLNDLKAAEKIAISLQRS